MSDPVRPLQIADDGLRIGDQEILHVHENERECQRSESDTAEIAFVGQFKQFVHRYGKLTHFYFEWDEGLRGS